MTKSSKPSLPDMHYLTEPERAQVHPAVVRSISIPSIPPDFPFNTPISDERRHRGPRFIIGWLEFQSPEQPDPEVARPGDVWIQLPSGHRKARVYACYNPQGKDWLPWAGNHIPTGGRGDTGNIPIHPFLNDHAQRKFFLVFNGTQFTWANPKGVSIILHTNPQIGTIGPAEAVIKWLKVTGVGRPSPASDDEGHSTSAPLNGRKHAHPDHDGSPGNSASAPPEKKAKRVPPRQQSPPDLPLAVKLGAYAQAGATQQGWIMYIDGMPLHMPFPCINCTRTKAPCSGIPGERCGRCRFKRLGCSHHTQKPRERTASPAKEKEVPKAAATATTTATATAPESSPTTSALTGLMLRLPAMRAWVTTKPGESARAEDANKVPGQSSPRRVRIRESSVARSDNENNNNNNNIRSSSPLSSVHDHHLEPVSHHSESAILDERDDADVENLLDSSLVTASVMPVPDPSADADVDVEGEPRSSVTAAENSVPEKTLPQEGADGGDEDEEFARFVQMTLDGMARAQEGLRGVFALTRRRLVVKRTDAAAAIAPQVASVIEDAAAAIASVDACVPGGDDPVSAPH